MAEEQCLNCRNYKPTPPPGWQPTLAASPFDIWDLRQVVGQWTEWNDGWPGRCLLQPRPTEVMSVHWCAQWQVNRQFMVAWEGLFALHQSRAENAELKAELKAAQKLSLERYHRLQQRQKPPPRQPSITKT